LTARILVVTGVLVLGAGARAAEVTRVVSALDDDNAFDFNVTASWTHQVKSAFIKAESAEANGGLLKDLQYGQTRDVLSLRMDFGILWDVGLHVEAPLVLADNRHLDFDQSEGSGCTYPGQVQMPSCVNAANSQILQRGILPVSSTNDSWGRNASGQQYTSGSRVFQGPKRSGFESLNLGITWAPFNQRRDDTRPTWTLGFDAMLDVFSDMRYDAANPGGNTAVGPGYHQFWFTTAVSKRFRYFDPYFGAWYMLPVRTNGSLFTDPAGSNQMAVNPQQRGGVYAGVEQIAWENPRADQRVTVEILGRMEEHFYGKSASELWEALSGRSTCNDATQNTVECRQGIDNNLGATTGWGPYPGVTETQAYASFGGNVGLNVQVGKYTRFRGLFGLDIDEPHYITYAGAGKDTNGDGRVDEPNKLYRESLDAPGRRFRVEGTKVWSLFLQGSMMF
jgi:hypothetical protein